MHSDTVCEGCSEHPWEQGPGCPASPADRSRAKLGKWTLKSKDTLEKGPGVSGGDGTRGAEGWRRHVGTDLVLSTVTFPVPGAAGMFQKQWLEDRKVRWRE